MSAGTALLGVTGLYALLKLLSGEANHDDVLQDAAWNLDRYLPADSTLYADHIDEYKNPHTVVQDLNLDHVPDIVVRSGSASNLIVEVETASSLENSGYEAIQQLEAFGTRGYKNVLIVPDTGNRIVDEFGNRIDREVNGRVYVATPSSIVNLL